MKHKNMRCGVMLMTIMLTLLFAKAQDSAEEVDSDSRVAWAKDLSWQELTRKAAAENKFILVDCYATWCIPCKKMDVDVLTDSSIIDLVNDRFIAVKFQMDETDRDNASIRNRYGDVKAIAEQYKITAYPTYLVLSADGQLLNKVIGYKGRQQFYALLKNSIDPTNTYEDPDKMFDELIVNFRAGKPDFDNMPYMIRLSGELGKAGLRDSLLKSYYKHLQALDLKKVMTKDRISFIRTYISSFDDPFFSLFTNHASKINALMSNEQYCRFTIDSVLYRAIIEPSLQRFYSTAKFEDAKKGVRQPAWDSIKRTVVNKFGKLQASRSMRAAKAQYYRSILDFTSAAYYVSEQCRHGDLDLEDAQTRLYLNGYAWEIFLTSKNLTVLKRARDWMKVVTRKDITGYHVNKLDTYANLIYKINMLENVPAKEAITLEESAARLAAEYGKRWNDQYLIELAAEFKGVADKMKKGQPTWEN